MIDICDLYCILQEKDIEKLKEFIAEKKPHVIAVTSESRSVCVVILIVYGFAIVFIIMCGVVMVLCGVCRASLKTVLIQTRLVLLCASLKHFLLFEFLLRAEIHISL